MLFQFLCQPHPDLHAVDEAGAFVVAAEGADRIHDFVHLPERHAIHQLIQFMEILLDLVIIHQIDFVVGFVEHVQNGLGRLVRELLFCQLTKILMLYSTLDK